MFKIPTAVSVLEGKVVPPTINCIYSFGCETLQSLIQALRLFEHHYVRKLAEFLVAFKAQLRCDSYLLSGAQKDVHPAGW